VTHVDVGAHSNCAGSCHWTYKKAVNFHAERQLGFLAFLYTKVQEYPDTGPFARERVSVERCGKHLGATQVSLVCGRSTPSCCECWLLRTWSRSVLGNSYP
jgi:hypothetical protein